MLSVVASTMNYCQLHGVPIMGIVLACPTGSAIQQLIRGESVASTHTYFHCHVFPLIKKISTETQLSIEAALTRRLEESFSINTSTSVQTHEQSYCHTPAAL